MEEEPTNFLYPFIDAQEDDPQSLLADLAASAQAKAAESLALRRTSLESNADLLDQAPHQAHAASSGFHFHEPDPIISDDQRGFARRDLQCHGDFAAAARKRVNIGVIHQFRDDDPHCGGIIEPDMERLDRTGERNVLFPAEIRKINA